MASENETFDEVLRCMQNDIVHFAGKPVKHSRDLLQEYHDRFKAAHRREVDVVLKDRDEMFKSEQDTVAKTKEWFDEYQKLKLEVAELKSEVAELRECLKETMADAVAEYKNNSCFRNVKCGEIERCDTCKVMRWRKALKGSSND